MAAGYGFVQTGRGQARKLHALAFLSAIPTSRKIPMPFQHAVVWLDQTEAHVIHFTRDDAMTEVIKTTSQHQKAGVTGNNRAEPDHTYMDEVTAAVTDAKQILVVGPGVEKLVLMRHMAKSYGETAEKVISVETVDHPNDGQLLTYARKYFVKSDLTN
jgi:stalled ribosome rescue protein Dom34